MRTTDLVPGQIHSYSSVGALPSSVGPSEVRVAFELVRDGVVSEQQALSDVAGLFKGRLVELDELRGAIALVGDHMIRGFDDDSVLLSRLLLQAAESAGNSAAPEALDAAQWIYVAAGSTAMFGLPVGPLYRGVTSLTDERLERARERGESDGILAALAQAAAARMTLILEGRDHEWWKQERNWLRLLELRIDPSVLHGPHLPTLRLPDPLTEMQRAEEMLSELTQMEDDTDLAMRQLQLAKMATALGPHSSITPSHVVELLQAALDNMARGDGEEDLRVEVLLALDRVGGIRAQDRSRPVTTRPIQSVYRDFGSLVAIQTYRNVGWLAMRLGRADEAAELARDYLALDIRHGHDHDRVQSLDVCCHAGDFGALPCDIAEDPGLVNQRITPLAAVAHPDTLYFAYLHAALHSSDYSVASALLTAAADGLGGAPPPRWPELVAYVRGAKAYEHGQRLRAQPERRTQAALLLVTAVQNFLTLRAPSVARNAATVLIGFLRAHPEPAGDVLAQLPPLVARTVAEFPELADILAALGEVTAYTVRGGDPNQSIDRTVLHSQLFKGFATHVTLLDPGPATRSPAEEQLFQRLDQLRSSAPPEPSDQTLSPETIDGELLTLLYGVPSETLSGASALEQTRNVRNKIDTEHSRAQYVDRLHAALKDQRSGAASGPAAPRLLLGYGDVLEHLDEHTVFIDLYDGPTATGSFCSYAACYTRDEFWRGGGDSGSDFTGLRILDPRHPGRLLLGHQDAIALSELRRKLQDPPLGRRLVDREVAEALETNPLSTLAVPLTDYAAAGYERLCIWPHATTHYAPLHLMHVNGRPLADTWTVTTTPSLACLRSAAERPGHPSVREPMTHRLTVAASPDGGRSVNLPSVPELADQAEEIAATHHDALLLTGDHATPKAVLDAMSHSRYTHLAAHGTSDPFSAAFQTLHLSGADSGLTARRIAEADLRNVDLVTLAACETSLGRFTLLDDQSGIVASLLAAGVTAVISCLWPVRTAPCTAFFAATYLALASDDGGDMRHAFRVAQLETRRRYPAYRDWGAFVYSGGW